MGFHGLHVALVAKVRVR